MHTSQSSEERNLLLLFRFSFLIGATSLTLFVAGHAGLIGQTCSLAVAAGFILLTVFMIRGSGVSLSLSSPPAIMAMISLAVILPLTLLPPAARDELIYHLVIPRYYLIHGEISKIPFMDFSFKPINQQLLYLIPLAFGSDTLPGLIHLSFAILTSLAIYLYLEMRVKRGYALAGALLYMTTPIVARLSATAYVDLGLAFYTTLGLVAFLLWRESGFRERRWLIYSGISMGFALGTKNGAFFAIFILALMIVYSCAREKGMQLYAIRSGGIFLAVAFLLFSPWMIRNMLWTGNPLYPLLGGIFHGGGGAASAMHAPNISGMPPLVTRRVLYGESVFQIMLTPLRIFFQGVDGSHQYFDGLLNPFYLFFIPFSLAGTRDRGTKYMALFAIIFFALVFLNVDLVIRYLIPAIPPLIILIIKGFDRMRGIKMIRHAAAAAMAASFIFNGWYMVGLYQRNMPFRYLSGRETRDQYLSRMLPDYPVIKFANSNLPGDAGVLFILTGGRTYYWQRERVSADTLMLFDGAKDVGEVRMRLKKSGATHIFMNDPLFRRDLGNNLDSESLAVAKQFYMHDMSLLFRNRQYSLFKIL